MARPRLINKFGTLIGWNSATFNMFGREVEGIEQVKYEDEMSIDVAYGAGNKPIGKTKGNYKATASMNLYIEELIALQQQLPAGSNLYDLPDFDVVVQYEFNGNNYTDIIRNCSISKNPRETKNGEGKIVCEITLVPSHIDWNVK